MKKVKPSYNLAENVDRISRVQAEKALNQNRKIKDWKYLHIFKEVFSKDVENPKNIRQRGVNCGAIGTWIPSNMSDARRGKW